MILKWFQLVFNKKNVQMLGNVNLKLRFCIDILLFEALGRHVL